MKFITIIFFIISFITAAEATQKGKAYFAGGCFWCMEEVYEKLSGVEEVISFIVFFELFQKRKE